MSRETAEIIANSGYGSGDETASLLVQTPQVTVIVPAPTERDRERSSKPVLQRQDCTATFLTSPRNQLSGGAGSEESAASIKLMEESARSVPDIELHCRLDSQDRPQNLTSPVVSVPCRHRGSASGYQLIPQSYLRCRSCDRRASTAPMSSYQLARSTSRESVQCACCNNIHAAPAMFLTATPSSRIIRQSSQPETGVVCTAHCHHQYVPSASLRQLREPGDGIAGIAADSMRINGGMRPFKQGVLLCPQTLSQSRRTRLRRAFTEATSDTVTYVRTVGPPYGQNETP